MIRILYYVLKIIEIHIIESVIIYYYYVLIMPTVIVTCNSDRPGDVPIYIYGVRMDFSILQLYSNTSFSGDNEIKDRVYIMYHYILL